jgi:hypothetical protein
MNDDDDEPESKRQAGRDLRITLNLMWEDTETPVAIRGTAKSGRQQLQDNCDAILNDSVAPGDCQRALLCGGAEWTCTISGASRDTRGRARKTIRTKHLSSDGLSVKKAHFRPWHIVWLVKSAAPLPVGEEQYSHRCHNENCVNYRHGVWESDGMNKSRDDCRSGSHVILLDDASPAKVITLCPHQPCCLRPVVKRLSDALPLPIQL